MADDGKDRSRGELSPEDREAFRKRAADLSRRLHEAKAEQQAPKRGTTASSDRGEALGRAMRISTELIGGVVVGTGLGWLLDKWLGTWPLLFIVFFLLGSAAGTLNVVRAGLKMRTGPDNPDAGPAVPGDEDDER